MSWSKEKRKRHYQGLSLDKTLIAQIKEHIDDKPQYRGTTDFVRFAIINQMNYEKTIQ